MRNDILNIATIPANKLRNKWRGHHKPETHRQTSN